MFIPINRNKRIITSKNQVIKLKHGSSLLLNHVKKAIPHYGEINGDGILNYGGYVGMPRIKGLQKDPSSYHRIKQEIPIKPHLLSYVKDLKENHTGRSIDTTMIENLKNLKISGYKNLKNKKSINNLRFEL